MDDFLLEDVIGQPIGVGCSVIFPLVLNKPIILKRGVVTHLKRNKVYAKLERKEVRLTPKEVLIKSY